MSKEVKHISLLSIQNLFLNDIKYRIECTKTKLNCFNFHEDNSRNLFRKELIKNSGIYMLKYKHNNNLFYIGKALDLSSRLRSHYLRSSKGKNRLGFFFYGRLV